MRRLALLVAAVAYVAGGLAWLARDPGDPGPSDPGSTFDRSEAGASLARAYLAARGVRVERLGAPLRAASVAPDGVVLRLRPRASPAPERLLDPAEDAWVQAGGRLVLALAQSAAGVRVTADPAIPPPRKVHPSWPEVVDLRPSPRRRLSGAAIDEAVAVFSAGADPVVARLARGRGEVVLLACPEVIENGLLARADHLKLLAALAGRGRPVYFDEHAHGLSAERSLLALLLDWGLGPALLLGAAAGLALLWRGRARVGPAVDPWEDARSDAVDLTGSLAPLYASALRRDEAAALYYDALRREVHQRTGLRGAALEGRLAALTRLPSPPGRGAGRDMTEAELAEVLARVNAGFGGLGHAHTR